MRNIISRWTPALFSHALQSAGEGGSRKLSKQCGELASALLAAEEEWLELASEVESG